MTWLPLSEAGLQGTTARRALAGSRQPTGPSRLGGGAGGSPRTPAGWRLSPGSTVPKATTCRRECTHKQKPERKSPLGAEATFALPGCPRMPLQNLYSRPQDPIKLLSPHFIFFIFFLPFFKILEQVSIYHRLVCLFFMAWNGVQAGVLQNVWNSASA